MKSTISPTNRTDVYGCGISLGWSIAFFLSSASTSTLNPYAKSYYLDTVNEECSDDRVIALKQLFGGYGLGTYDLKYYNKVLDEAQGLLKDLEKNGRGSGNISRNFRQNKKVKAYRKTGRKNIFFSYGPIKQKDAANQFQIC